VPPPRDASLVRDHRDGNTSPIEPGYRLRRAVDELNAVYRADVSVINDDRAVAIEKDPGPQTRVLHLEHSGTPTGYQIVQDHLSLAHDSRSLCIRVPRGQW